MSVLRLTDYTLCEAALKHPDLRQSLYDAGSLLMEDVLVNLHGDEHRDRRRVEGAMFRRSFFREIEANLLPQMVAAVLSAAQKRTQLDLKWLSYRLMLQLSLVFSGIDRVDDSEDESEYLTALLARLGQAATLAQYQGHHRVQLEQDIREAIDEFDRAYFQPSKQRRLDSDVDPSEHKDILSLLLDHQSTLALTDAAMLREVGFFYLASAHTSVHSITHGFHELFTYLESTGLTVNNLLEDPLLLQRCAHESLRLHPSSPEAWRRAVRHLELPDGRSLAEGDEVIIDLQTANRDETVFGIDAEVFNPNRPRTIGANPWGLSFGSGMHVCIGLNLVAGAVVNRSNPPDLQTHQWGSLTTIYRLLLAAGLRPDQDQPPEKDLESARDTWLHYPVCLP